MDGLGSKERIFHAAMSVALRRGFGKVTLNLVAREAGFSKGGLLYHFAAKNDLIRAMLERYAVQPTRLAGALGAQEFANGLTSDIDPLAVAALIAAAENPSLLEPIRGLLDPGEADRIDGAESVARPLPLVGCLANRLDLAR